jgi:hypothetical protein
VYWVNSCPSDGGTCSGELLKVGVDGGPVTTLVPSGVGSFAVDDTSVYWVTTVGSFSRVLRMTPK